MSLSFGPLNSTRSCAPNAAQPVPPGQPGRLRRPLPGATIHHRCAQRTGGREEPHCHTEAVALSRPSSPSWRHSCSRRSRRPCGYQGALEGDRPLPVRPQPGRIGWQLPGPQPLVRRLRQVPDHARQLERLGTQVGRELATRTRAHATRRPSRAARSTPCTTGLAVGGGSPTGGSPAPRRPPAGARTRRATSGTSWRSTTARASSKSRGGIHRFSEKSRAIDYRGSWERAEHPYYRGDRARQAKRKGQTATFRFTGSQVAWNGPNGPTRGKAKVYLDGQYVKTVDFYSAQVRRAQPDLHEDLRRIPERTP